MVQSLYWKKFVITISNCTISVAHDLNRYKYQDQINRLQAWYSVFFVGICRCCIFPVHRYSRFACVGSLANLTTQGDRHTDLWKSVYIILWWYYPQAKAKQDAGVRHALTSKWLEWSLVHHQTFHGPFLKRTQFVCNARVCQKVICYLETLERLWRCI